MKSLLAMIFFLGFQTAWAGTQPYISEIGLYAAYCPRSWVEADGREMDKDKYQTLFSLLGYNYGGKDDKFRIPDLREMAPAKMKYCMAIEGYFPPRN